MADDKSSPDAEQVSQDAGTKSKQKRKRKPSVLSSSPKPKFKEMVEEAVSVTQDRSGASLQAIKKYLQVNYGIDSHAPYIRNAIKKAVACGDLIQVKGVGASGSFKLNSTSTPKPAAKTNRQKDSDKVRQEKDAKSEEDAKRIAKNAKKALKKRQALRIEGTKTKLKAKPATANKKIKTHKKIEKKMKSIKKSPKTKKGSRK